MTRKNQVGQQETADEYMRRCAKEDMVPLARKVDRLRAAESRAPAMKDPMHHLNTQFAHIFPKEVTNAFQQNCQDIEARDAQLTDLLREELGKATALVGEAMQSPRRARVELTQAIVHLHLALKAARQMDPEQ